MGLSAIFSKIALKPMWLHSNHCIALHCDCITKHAHGEAVLFLAACYLEKK